MAVRTPAGAAAIVLLAGPLATAGAASSPGWASESPPGRSAPVLSSLSITRCLLAPKVAKPGTHPAEVRIVSAPPAGAVVTGAAYVVATTARPGVEPCILATPGSVCVATGRVVGFVGVGHCTVTAWTPATAHFAAASSSQSLAVGRGTPVVTITAPPPAHPTAKGVLYSATAVSSSHVVPRISAGPPSVCSAGGQTVFFLGAGTCTVTASVPATADFNAASTSETFVVAPAAAAG
jgi:hypothetical protein